MGSFGKVNEGCRGTGTLKVIKNQKFKNRVQMFKVTKLLKGHRTFSCVCFNLRVYLVVILFALSNFQSPRLHRFTDFSGKCFTFMNFSLSWKLRRYSWAEMIPFYDFLEFNSTPAFRDTRCSHARSRKRFHCKIYSFPSFKFIPIHVCIRVP